VGISISDNGIGFDDQYMDRIFTIFQRLHPRENYDGTGIGLAIAKKIIEKHGGAITASGRDGAGATFDLYLPYKTILQT
jgi:two-component system CheB/CheR fusion protein